ncbi:menaquinone-dependent protoporphyrinogen IX dehydrogenase [Gammaproteobacteria bacterium]|jgi:menaquinone-dependent protoporphyrinogen oxidase|nr:menaquinone-dependent protoporphyrinogen IX dehydrogenase [Gammaproteobacteria bacterium]|tara:strand:- start:603 stop:1115 length:513 start_codon:yes stop_codon:yes gene_type:complete
MHQNLIIYSSTDGQTIKICERIMSIIGDCKIVSIDEAKNENLSKYEKVIVGASIRYGKHKPELYEYISENCDHLIDINASFFSVNVVARKPEKNTPLTNPYVQKFLSISQWHPSLIGVFAGKIDYPRYGVLDKFMIRLIMWITKGPTDTKNVYEFTNWDDVDSFAKKIST